MICEACARELHEQCSDEYSCTCRVCWPDDEDTWPGVTIVDYVDLIGADSDE